MNDPAVTELLKRIAWMEQEITDLRRARFVAE
jgi:uncharacterized small protein (DUF1192 family)